MTMKRLVIARRISQTFFLGLFTYILWSTTYPLTGPLPTNSFFSANPYVVLIISLCERVILPSFLIAAGMLLATLILGRFYCGWICPLGTFIDWTGALRGKRPEPGDAVNKVIRKPKYVILAATVVAAMAGIQIAWPFEPMVIAARFVSMNLIPTVTIAIDKLFVFLIRDLHMSGPLYGIYQSLKMSLLGVKAAYFSNSGLIFAYFAAICLAALFLSRAWCREICPLGALYALAAKPSLLKRTTTGCIRCRKCERICRMGAIREDIGYTKSECVLCMDCVYSCPVKVTRFTFFNGASKAAPATPPEGGITRGQFLTAIISSLFLMGSGWRIGRGGTDNASSSVVRPPAARKEPDFKSRCIRCGNCMKVCPTNGLQPCLMESGIGGIWTPRLEPDIGYCEFNCTLCGKVCPTDAIKKLTQEHKHVIKLGLAKVNRSICLAWNEKKQCLVCEEHCPVPKKAITADTTSGGGSKFGRPVVNKDLCVGCGICQTKCPARPSRAIKVFPEGADRP